MRYRPRRTRDAPAVPPHPGDSVDDGARRWQDGELDTHLRLSLRAKLDPRQAQVVEMRFFAGMSVEEVAGVLGVSKRTVEGDWTMARAWLMRELSG